MTNSQPPLSPNSAFDGPGSPVPKWSAFSPVGGPPVSPPPPPPSSRVVEPYPQPIASPVSPYSSTSSYTTTWSPASSHGSSQLSSPTTNQPGGPRRYREDDASVKELFMDRSHTEQYRMKGSQNRSLQLLDRYAESGKTYQELEAQKVAMSTVMPGEPSPDQAWSYDNASKNEVANNRNNRQASKDFMERSITEQVRFNEAKQRSLAMLETSVQSQRKNYGKADQAYKAQNKSVPREDEIYDFQKSFRRKNMHLMASSTRKKKSSSNNSATTNGATFSNHHNGSTRDPETIAGMKNQLDLDREKAAEKKALLLLDITSMF